MIFRSKEYVLSKFTTFDLFCRQRHSLPTTLNLNLLIINLKFTCLTWRVYVDIDRLYDCVTIVRVVIIRHQFKSKGIPLSMSWQTSFAFQWLLARWYSQFTYREACPRYIFQNTRYTQLSRQHCIKIIINTFYEYLQTLSLIHYKHQDWHF